MEAIMQSLAIKTLALPVFSMAAIATWFAFVIERGHSRAALAKLDDTHLDDIGVNYKQANKEFRKPFFM